MKAWLIDDERPCLDELAWLLKQYPDLELEGMDTDPAKALASIAERPPDVVFLDIDMPKIDGLELALRIQEKYPGVIVIFVTAHAQYALDAFKAHPLDFLLKPVRRVRLDDCIVHLRKQYTLLHPEGAVQDSFTLHCFGTFELICENEIKWGTRRVRELLLYLIDRNGSPASKPELLGVMFGGQEDKRTIHNLYMTIYRLKCVLYTLDPERKLIRLEEDNVLIIAPGVCDFRDYMCFARENAVITEANAVEAARALSLCRGPYLEKENFEWASESDNEVETEYERIALGLGSCHIAAGRLAEAERVLTALLLRNALCEEAHTLLLDLALQTGNRDTYLGRYEQYARILKKELHLKPAARYREQYKRLQR
ncbi:response regulator [Desulfosporosinus fructosivorans]